MSQRPEQEKELAVLKSAVENTNEGFVTIDADHRVLFFNKAAERIFGYRREEVIGRDLDRIMAPSCSRNHRLAVRRYVETRIPSRIGHDTEITATRKNGETFPANISFSVSEVKGKLYFTGIVKDLTETRSLEAQVSRAERLAALGQLVSEITHEIKNPLMVIGGFAEQLIRRASDEKIREKLLIISKEVGRLEQLLKELREFYTPGRPAKESVDLADLVREVTLLLGDACTRQGVQVTVSADEPLRVRGDRHKLKQVLLNVIKNAIEAMPEGGALAVYGLRSGDRVRVSVADTGTGIAPEDLSRVFFPFFTTKREGTGLGLTISKGIVEDHEGGSLELRPREGGGTVCEIELPADPLSLETPKSEQESKQQGARHGAC